MNIKPIKILIFKNSLNIIYVQYVNTENDFTEVIKNLIKDLKIILLGRQNNSVILF